MGGRGEGSFVAKGHVCVCGGRVHGRWACVVGGIHSRGACMAGVCNPGRCE